MGISIKDFKVYRSTVSGGPYTLIYTTPDGSETTYWDGGLVSGQTYYYVVTFEYQGSDMTYESPYSNQIQAIAQTTGDLVPPDAVWDVTDISDPDNPIHKGNLKAPFSNHYPDQYPNLFPLPNAYWPTATGSPVIWSNRLTLNIPSTVDLHQVQYSIAIDNEYTLYVNGSSNPIDTGDNGSQLAIWHQFKLFQTVAPNLLHHGTNDIDVVIKDDAVENYFSMIITTSGCGGP